LSDQKVEVDSMAMKAKLPIDEAPPARLKDDLCNVHEQVRQPSDERAETEDAITSARTQETVPHPHDVLFGDYHHAGYIQFLAWVAESSIGYRIAPNDKKKTRIAREVIALVQNQNPPGRFLQRDPNYAGWWIEVDDGKATEIKTRTELWNATKL
jgi:hypothetical protein